MFLEMGCITLIVKASGKVNRWLTRAPPMACGRMPPRLRNRAKTPIFRRESGARGERLKVAYPGLTLLRPLMLA